MNLLIGLTLLVIAVVVAITLSYIGSAFFVRGYKTKSPLNEVEIDRSSINELEAVLDPDGLHRHDGA